MIRNPNKAPPRIDASPGPTADPNGVTARLRRIVEQAGNLAIPDERNSVVLLVDDQLMIGESLRRMLADQPNIVFHFCSESGSAITTAERIAPTVILQDLIMPGIEGLTLLREYRAREATRNTPIIMLSTREDATTKKDAFALGANDYIVKFPDKIELIARIRYHSQAYLSRRQRDDAYVALHESQRQLMAANIELQRISNMDGLTGLSNRRRFDEYASNEWLRALREKTSFGLLLVDIDRFKNYNDANGHLAGDDLIRQVGQKIRACCGRPADLPARYGGDEFAIVLPGVQAKALDIIGERVCQAARSIGLESSPVFSDTNVTLSVGGAVTVPTMEDGLLDLISTADRNLYAAKAQGRNRFVSSK
jgi:two-component system chemotaxis family response regulator WspR